MNSEAIIGIINEELKEELDIKNVCGLDLTERLITPTIQKYWDSKKMKSYELFWTVLEETPERNGYVIYFNEATNLFGLGIQSENEFYNIGPYGSFLKSLYSI